MRKEERNYEVKTNGIPQLKDMPKDLLNVLCAALLRLLLANWIMTCWFELKPFQVFLRFALRLHLAVILLKGVQSESLDFSRL